MADKEKTTGTEIIDNSKIIKIRIEDEIKKSFMSYAMMVNVSRAIPDARDGLKPVHRRILYSMYELGVTSNTPHKKSARIVGDTMGKYHPHGDSAIYDALVRMAQPWSMSVPLIDGHGNFGSIDADPPAAMRYTEARLSTISNEMLRDIDKNTVDFKPNFDESLQEPKILPSRFPNLLVNGSEGIAVGMATSIPPHNLTEVINGVIAVIDDEEISVDSLIKLIPAPDFPTGGLIMGRAAIKHAYKTGRGGMVIRAKADIQVDDKSGKQRIVITEIPYQVVKATLIKNIADICVGKDKKIEGVTDIHEQSDREGLRIVIDLKRDAQPQVVLNQLYKHSQMQISVGIIFLALVNGTPKFLNLKEMLVEYLEHQKKVILRRTKFDLDAAEARAHILDGLVIALANIDEVIKIIRTSEDKQDAQAKLMKKFILSEKQSNAILEMKLHRLAKLEVDKIKAELAELKLLIADLKSILASGKRVLEIIKRELTEIRDKYGMERRTELVHDFGEIEIADLIEKEDVVVSMSHFGYIKRLPLAEYRAQKRGGRGANAHTTKEEDFVESLFVTSTHHDLLFFTNVGKVYCIKAYEVPEAAKATKGRAIVNLLQLDTGLEAQTKERVTACIPVENFDNGHLMMATADGLVKKTEISEFKKIRRVGKVAITLRESDELISVQLTSGRDEILMASSTGKCIRFSEEDVRSMGRTASGVKSIHLDAKNDKVVDMTVLMPGYEILTVSCNGYGKRSEVDDYRLQSRAGKGIKAGIFNEKTGPLVNLKQVKPEQDVMLISDNGTIIRTRAREISKISRDTQGVRIMKVAGNAQVVCVAIAQAEQEEE
ncbi:MAG: DNA gyrase subunit A [Christensenellaceae bacterium]|jgi:DNA gyrase subunit A|nr:DNA gyrase subunit A [Christensenellaceae bacterium]